MRGFESLRLKEDFELCDVETAVMVRKMTMAGGETEGVSLVFRVVD